MLKEAEISFTNVHDTIQLSFLTELLKQPMVILGLTKKSTLSVIKRNSPTSKKNTLTSLTLTQTVLKTAIELVVEQYPT